MVVISIIALEDKMSRNTKIVSLLIVCVISLLLCGGACAIEKTVYTPLAGSLQNSSDGENSGQKQIMKRTPSIDGIIDVDEWDLFSRSGESSQFCNWDDKNIYLASLSPGDSSVEWLLDIEGNGVNQGVHNYVIRISSTDNGVVYSVSRIHRNGSSDPQPVLQTISDAEIDRIVFSSSYKNGLMSVEMSLPLDMFRGTRIINESTLGVSMSTGLNSSMAQGETYSSLNDTLTNCKLVIKRLESLKPIILGFDLVDSRVAKGDELRAKLYIQNNSDEYYPVTQYIIAGEGNAGTYMNSMKYVVDGISAGSRIGREYTSLVPYDMPSGTWVLAAAVNTRDNRVGAALASFDVVEKYEVEVHPPNFPVKNTVEEVTIAIDIRNNTNHRIRGDISIELPMGWELWREVATKEFSAGSKGQTSVKFQTKPPLGAFGEIPVRVKATCEEVNITKNAQFNMVNP